MGRHGALDVDCRILFLQLFTFVKTLKEISQEVTHCSCCIILARFDQRAHSKIGWGMFSVLDYKRKLVWGRVLILGEKGDGWSKKLTDFSIDSTFKVIFK